MKHLHIASMALSAVVVVCSPLTVAGAESPGNQPVPLTPWGDPDLRGVWTTATLTPLERPRSLEAQDLLSDAQAADLERQTLDQRAASDGVARAGSVGGYNQVWMDAGTKITGSRRTSLIVDPEDGRIPWKPRAGVENEKERRRYGVGPYETWTDLDTGERCITDGLPNMVPIQPYNMNFRIVQTEDHVAYLHEMYHEVRIIPLDGRPHLDLRIGQWLGDARGWWEGETLVVETTNFADLTQYYWSSPWRKARPTFRLVERFRRLDAETIDYRVTVEDPTMFTQPWTVSAPMTTNQASRGVTPGPVLEYACHEGNYAMPNVLGGARAAEAE